jgi:hypothetical protein
LQVTQCSVDPGPIKLNYYGGEAGEFYAIGNLIQVHLKIAILTLCLQGGIDKAIKEKICILPPLLRDFIREKVRK